MNNIDDVNDIDVQTATQTAPETGEEYVATIRYKDEMISVTTEHSGVIHTTNIDVAWVLQRAYRDDLIDSYRCRNMTGNPSPEEPMEDFDDEIELVN